MNNFKLRLVTGCAAFEVSEIARNSSKRGSALSAGDGHDV